MSTEGQDRRLHRYFDGDLPEEEREALQRELAADPTLRRKLLALSDVRTLVRGSAEASAADVDGDAMWAAIAQRLPAASASDASQAKKPTRPALELVPGPKRVPAPAAEDPRVRRRRVFGVGIGVLALAAAVLLVFLRPGDPAIDESLATRDVPDSALAVDPPDALRTEVLAVDFGTNVGTIFAVEGNEGQRYAVVWLDDAVKIDEGGTSADQETPN